MTKILFNGLGVMGSGMARRLLNAGFNLTIYNRTPGPAEQFRDTGARIASNPGDGAKDVDVVITMVSDDWASREVWTGCHGVLTTAQPGTLLIDSSTITPQCARDLAAHAEKAGCFFLDAPVTGSRPEAQSGRLLFLVGGHAEVVQRAHPVLKHMSRDVLHLGGNGAGATMKLINNFLCGVQAASLAEAQAWVESSGLRRTEAMAILTAGAPGSPLVKVLAERMNKQLPEVNFRLELMAKDLAYARNEAKQVGVELLTGAAALQRFEAGVGKGLGDRDISALINIFKD